MPAGPKSLPGRLGAALRGGEGIGARLLRGSLLAASISGAGVVLSFATQLILARSLGADDYGVYSVVLSWLNVLQIFATLGLENAGVRFIGAYAGSGDWGAVKGFARFGVRAAIGTGLALVAIGGLVLLCLPSLARGMTLPFATLAILLPCYAAMLIQTSVLQGAGDVVGAQAPTSVLRPVLFISLVLCASMVAGRRLPPGEVLLLNGITGIVVLSVGAWLIARRTGDAVPLVDRERRRGWLKVSLALLTMSVFQMGASQQLGTFIVGLLRAPRDAGIYSAANQLSLPLMLGIQAVHFVAAPMMADLHFQQRREDLQRVITLAFTGSVAFALPCFLGVVVFGKWVLGLYGPAFVAGYPILLVLSATVVVVAAGGGIGSWLLTVTGHERVGVRIVAAAACCNLFVSLVLVHRYGMLGAAIGAATAVSVRLLLVAVYVHREMGLSLIPVRLVLRRMVQSTLHRPGS